MLLFCLPASFILTYISKDWQADRWSNEYFSKTMINSKGKTSDQGCRTPDERLKMEKKKDQCWKDRTEKSLTAAKEMKIQNYLNSSRCNCYVCVYVSCAETRATRVLHGKSIAVINNPNGCRCFSALFNDAVLHTHRPQTQRWLWEFASEIKIMNKR